MIQNKLMKKIENLIEIFFAIVFEYIKYIVRKWLCYNNYTLKNR